MMAAGDWLDWIIKEDLPQGDRTTDALGVVDYPGYARVVAKQDLVLSGCAIFETVLARFDAGLEVKWHYQPGQKVLKHSLIATLKGNLITLLKAERIGLNFLGHLCGVATLTNQYVSRIAHTQTKILDTRKTLPGLRIWEKEAVRDGGGENHRMNLSESVLIKENHMRVAGGLTAAVNSIRQSGISFIATEASSASEVAEAVKAKVQWILLDNMSNEELRAALTMIPREIKTEASGNMHLDRIASVAETGVNYISIGALTHSAPCSDLSMLFEW